MKTLDCTAKYYILFVLCRKDESHFCVHFVLGHGQETWLRWLCDVLTFQQHAPQPKIIVTEIEMSLIAITTTFLLKVAVVVMIVYVW